MIVLAKYCILNLMVRFGGKLFLDAVSSIGVWTVLCHSCCSTKAKDFTLLRCRAVLENVSES